MSNAQNIAYAIAIDDARRGLQTARAAVDAARTALVGKPWPGDFIPSRLITEIDAAISKLPSLPCTTAAQPDDLACTSEGAR